MKITKTKGEEMNYRITEIGGWFRVRDENNEELGQGNSMDIAVTRAISDLRAKLEEAEKKVEALEEELRQ